MCLSFFVAKKIRFLDTSNRGKDFEEDVWNLGRSSLGDVSNQKKMSGILGRVTSENS